MPIKGKLDFKAKDRKNQSSINTLNKAFQHFSYVSTSSSAVFSISLVQLHVFPYKHLLLQAFSFKLVRIVFLLAFNTVQF